MVGRERKVVKSLYPVQRAHVEKIKAALLQQRAALDSSATGTGKTLCAIIAAKELGMPPFVICPKAVIPAWERELKEQGVSGAVINYEKVKTGKRFGKWEGKKWVWQLPPNVLLIWDEAHRCKNPQSQNCRMLIASKEYSNLMLSATIASDPTEMRGVGYLLGLFELPKFWNWCRSHGCKPNPWGAMEFDRRKTGALTKIHERIYPNLGDRMTIADMAGHFADNLIIEDPLDFGDDGGIAKLYSEMEDELRELKSEMATDSKNPAAQALVSQLRARQAVELLKIPVVHSMIEDLLEEGNSVAVFLNFNASIEALLERLPRVSVSIVRGGQSAEERQGEIDHFQRNETRVILCNIEAGGVGVSLHDRQGEFPRVSLISPNFNEKSLVQVLGRTHRAGGKSPSVQRLLVAANTIEEKVARAVKEKIKSQDLLNGAESSLSNFASEVSYPDNIEKPHMPETPVPDHSSRAHAEHSPSQLKMFEICPGYLPRGGTNVFAERGTRIHEALESGDITVLQDAEEQAIATKCFDYVQQIIAQKAQTASLVATHNEIKFDIDLNGELTFGTCDLALIWSDDTATMIDYKTGFGAVEDAEVNCQAWAYTIGGFQKFPHLKSIDFFFLLPVRDEVTFATFERDRLPEMQLRLQTIIRRAKAGEIFNPQPGVCDYCSRQAGCPKLAEKALLVADRYTQGFKLPKGGGSLEDMNDPASLSLLLKLAPIMESWAEGVKKQALERALNDGWEIPGFRLTERKTPRSITSVLGAYEAVKDTVSITDFLAACTKVSVPDLEKNFAESVPRGKKGQAKQDLVDRLTDAGVLKQDGSIHVLKVEKN